MNPPILLHLLLAVSLLGVHDLMHGRSIFHYGFWPIKALFVIGCWFATIFVPNIHLSRLWYFDLVLSIAFAMIQSMLLIEAVYTLSTWLVSKHEQADHNRYKWIMVFFALLLLVFVFGMSIFCFSNYNDIKSVLLMTFNLALCMALVSITLVPSIQESNPGAGVLVAGIVCSYMTFLVASALNSLVQKDQPPGLPTPEPPNTSAIQDLPPSQPIDIGGSSFTAALKNLASRVTTTLANAPSTSAPSMEDTGNPNGPLGPLEKSVVSLHYPHPYFEKLLTAIAILFLVMSLMAASSTMRLFSVGRRMTGSGLEEGEPIGEGGEETEDDESGISLTMFHLAMAMILAYIAMMMTDWVREIPTDTGFALGHANVFYWAKLSISWASGLLYLWTLLAPKAFTYREFG